MARKSKASGHHFTVNIKPSVIKVTDDYTHHREVYLSTGDLTAYRKMLDSVIAEQADAADATDNTRE